MEGNRIFHIQYLVLNLKELQMGGGCILSLVRQTSFGSPLQLIA